MAIKTFTTGEVLTASDTNTYLNNGGLVYISTTTATSGSSVTVSNCFSSTYDAYKIIATGGGTAAATPIAFQLSGITTGVYYGGVIYFAYAGGGPAAPSAVGFSGATNWQEVGAANVNGCNLNMDIQNANLAKHPRESANRHQLHCEPNGECQPKFSHERDCPALHPAVSRKRVKSSVFI